MRRIIKDQQIIEDRCQHLADDAVLPPDSPFTVSLERLRKEREILKTRKDVGVRILNDVDIDVLWDEIEDLPQIVLNFPVFGDGRAMSQARVLRDRYQYRGEIRAIGDVLRDQMHYMHRCGINAFEVRPDRSLEDALKAFSDYSLSYQAAADTHQNIFRCRATS